MAQKMTCLNLHEEYIQHWDSGIWICMLCAAKDQMAQDARDALIKAKMAEKGIILGRDHTHYFEESPL